MFFNQRKFRKIYSFRRQVGTHDGNPVGGHHLYAAGYYDNAVVAFTRDSVTGRLTFEEMQTDGSSGVDGLSAISALAISPDGYHLYTASYYDSAVAVFQVKTPPVAPDPPDTGGDDPPGDAGGGGGGCFINTLSPPWGSGQ